ncbi:PREDICTED: venom serine protease-like [Trachymyrmex cornetzi]|uniref:venom serine protease-like n=1 Tax=Trachymyrmex cornetzi TaxID=471704 RepID=UPI00084EDA93|nr:PREDICTED: venom serine protease-like [Trachymyrmex cornetzi]
MMEFRWKFYENIKEVKVLFGLVLSLLVLNGVEPNCNEVLYLEEGQTYQLYNYPKENNCTWQFYSPISFEATCYIDIDCNENGLRVNDERSTFIFCGTNPFAFEGFNSFITITFVSPFNPGQFMCEIETEIETSCQCGKKKVTRIVGGEETDVNEFPCMVGFVNIRTDPNIIYCGGTIISERHILTAAHCVHNITINETVVDIGEHDTSTGHDTNATEIYKLNKCMIHPYYDMKETDNDIAICETAKSIKYSAEVGPVCLPFKHKNDSFIDESVTALGWGLLEFLGEKPVTLQKVNLTAVLCEKYSNSKICTFAPGKDTCQMDSGGPVLWQDSITHNLVLIGIISKGIGCASGEPGINTRVGTYIDWIESVTQGVQYCKIE